MPRFPIKEADILHLAERMIAGFKTHSQELPRPPVPVEQMERELADAAAGLSLSTQASAAAMAATAEKDRRFKQLTETMTLNLRDSEIRTRRNPRLLQALGWAPRRARRAMRAPGEVRSPRILEQLEDAVDRSWKKPVGRGRVVVYQVQRQTGGGTWVDGANVAKTRVLLLDQEQGVVLAYKCDRCEQGRRGTAERHGKGGAVTGGGWRVRS